MTLENKSCDKILDLIITTANLGSTSGLLGYFTRIGAIIKIMGFLEMMLLTSIIARVEVDSLVRVGLWFVIVVWLFLLLRFIVLMLFLKFKIKHVQMAVVAIIQMVFQIID